MAAIIEGRESLRSAPVVIRVSGGNQIVSSTGEGTTGSAAGLTPASSTSASSGDRRYCSNSTPARCFDVTWLHSSGHGLSSPSVLPDGRLFVIEDKRVVRLGDGASFDEEPAFAVTDPSTQVVAVTADVTFGDSGLVWLATVHENESHERRVSVLRTRLVGGRLGEVATILPDLLLPGPTDPSLSQDRSRRLYVTLESGGPGRVPGPPFEVHRYAVDGRVPDDTGQRTPVLAVLEPGATGGVVALEAGHTWLAWTDAAGVQRLGVLPEQPLGTLGPVALPALALQSAGADARRLTAMAFARPEGGAPFLMAGDSAGDIWGGPPALDGSSTSLGPLASLGGRIASVVAGNAGDFYVIYSADEGTGHRTNGLVHLVPAETMPSFP
jgi:hypothetical protein